MYKFNRQKIKKYKLKVINNIFNGIQINNNFKKYLKINKILKGGAKVVDIFEVRLLIKELINTKNCNEKKKIYKKMLAFNDICDDLRRKILEEYKKLNCEESNDDKKKSKDDCKHIYEEIKKQNNLIKDLQKKLEEKLNSNPCEETVKKLEKDIQKLLEVKPENTSIIKRQECQDQNKELIKMINELKDQISQIKLLTKVLENAQLKDNLKAIQVQKKKIQNIKSKLVKPSSKEILAQILIKIDRLTEFFKERSCNSKQSNCEKLKNLKI